MAEPVAAIVIDIEGTTTPIAFVTETLFPYAAQALPDFVRECAGEVEVAAALAAARELAGDPSLTDEAVVGVLLEWIAADRKATPLKTLQGLIWSRGYADGTLRSQFYDDVAPALRRWRRAERRLFVYSSGSVEAQRLLFRHGPPGDLTTLIEGYFDTRVGPKLERQSYARIAGAIGVPASRILFLSDHDGELDAAAAAGWRTASLDRDGIGRSGRHPVHRDFDSVEAAHLDVSAPG
jgi:enolase-phosphatase E1